SLSSPLAAALAAFAEQSWFGTCVLLDADDQALTLATVGSADGMAQLLDVRSLPHLNLRVWRERLLNALADCCILDSRWDPRESPTAEQALYDQLDEVLDGCCGNRMVKVTVQAGKRFQNLVLQPRDAATFCGGLRRQVLAEVQAILTAPWPDGAPGVVLLTAAAARLPGLAVALQASLPTWGTPAGRKPKTSFSTLEDFGSNLLDDSGEEAGSLVILSADAAARGAHSVAAF